MRISGLGHRTDNKWTKKETEWQLEIVAGRGGRGSGRKIKLVFTRAGWNTLTWERKVENAGKGLCPALD